MRQGVITNLMN